MVARQMHMHVVCRKKKIQTAKLVNSGRSAEGQKRERTEGGSTQKHLAIRRKPQDVNNFLKTTPRDRD